MSDAVSMSVARVLSGQDGMKAWRSDTYRAFHQHPELPHREKRDKPSLADWARRPSPVAS